MNRIRIKALIFDMDGTLVDSEPLHLSAYQSVLARHDQEFSEEENRKYLGQKDLEMASDLISRRGLTLSPRDLVSAKDEEFFSMVTKAPPMAGVMETLEEAKREGLRLAVASSSNMQTVELIIRSLGIIDYFEHLITGDQVANGKPAPDIFLLAAERMEVKPQECLVLEDTDAGVHAAKRAGMFCVAIPCEATKHQSHDEADSRLKSMAELRLLDWL